MAWLRNWVHGLHAAAAPRGVQVGHIAIGAWIGRQPGATAPEELAPLYWELHTQHDQVEKIFPQRPGDDVDRSLIEPNRRDHNRPGFAVRLVTVRYTGKFLEDLLEGVQAELVA